MEAARTFKDSDFLKTEIEKLKARIEQQTSAEQTAQGIEAILADGKAKEAGELASSALKQFGDSDAATRLSKLKLQADALAAGDLADNATKHKRFRDEA